MSELGDKVRRERESWVQVGGHEFCVRRPARLALPEMGRDNMRMLVCRCVVDWKRVSERDLFKGASDKAVPFDADACEEFLSDRPDLFGPVLERLEQMVAAHNEAREDVEKNSG